MNHTRKRIAIGLAVAALAPGVAQASIPHEPDRTSQAAVTSAVAGRSAPPIGRMDGALPPPSRPAVTAGVGGRAAPPIGRLDGSLPPPSRPIVIEKATGFDWTDAGIGFAAAAGLALLGAGSVVTVRSRRQFGSPAH